MEQQSKRRRRDRRPRTDPLLAVGYGRISKDEEKDKDKCLSLAAQEADFYRWCSKNGIRSLGWETDDDVCGATRLEERAGLPRAIELLHEHRAGLLVITKRDRLARDTIEAAIIERAVQDKGARIICVDGTGASDSPTDVFQTRMLDAVAELERGFIRARTKRALAQKALRGECVSRFPPYGYKFERSPSDAKIRIVVEVAEEQAVMSRILSMHSEGRAYNNIAVYLNSEGIPARGRLWYPATVRAICARNTAKSKEHE